MHNLGVGIQFSGRRGGVILSGPWFEETESRDDDNVYTYVIFLLRSG